MRIPALVREEPLVFALSAAAAAGYALHSWVRHVRYETARELALFDQTVWHYSRFEAPSTTLINPVVGSFEHFPYQLGDHFSPILAVLGPLYWIWADARMLLLAQAVLVAAAAVPVFLFARLQVGRLAAYCIAAGYLLFWGVHAAVVTDFHEVAFAPLLIASAIYFTAVERWRAVLVALALLLLVKEDLGALVAFFGLYLLLLRQIRIGVVCVVAGTAWLMLTTKVLMPLFAGGHEYRYWYYDRFGPDLPHALWTIVRDPTLPFLVALDDSQKVETMFFLFATFLGLAVYSPLILLTVPLIAARMLTDTPSPLWAMGLHYSLTIAPIVAMASAQGLRNVLGFLSVRRLALAATVIAALTIPANLAKSHAFMLDDLVETSFYQRSAEQRLADEALAQVPDHSGSVAASPPLVPHLSERSTIYADTADVPLTEYLVYQARGVSVAARINPQAALERVAELEVVRERRARYRVLFENAAFVVLVRTG